MYEICSVMTSLRRILNSSGALDRWRSFDRFEVHLSAAGSILAKKTDAGALKDIVVTGETRFQSVEIAGILNGTDRGLCRADWVALESASGAFHSEQMVASDHFARVGASERWNKFDLLYYCGMAMWNFVNGPYLLADLEDSVLDYTANEVDGEAWQSIRVRYPDHMAAESREQIFHFDSRNRHRRTDYLGSAIMHRPVAHLMSAHQSFSDIPVPTLKRARFLDEHGEISQEAVAIDVEIFDLIFSRSQNPSNSRT
jgi:hypothetical protein